jgi:hypothetical protein
MRSQHAAARHERLTSAHDATVTTAAAASGEALAYIASTAASAASGAGVAMSADTGAERVEKRVSPAGRHFSSFASSATAFDALLTVADVRCKRGEHAPTALRYRLGALHLHAVAAQHVYISHPIAVSRPLRRAALRAHVASWRAPRA